MNNLRVTERDLEELHRLHLALLLQLDQVDTRLRRLRWWVLTLALLLLALTVVVLEMGR
jgi:hypothetical protein